MLRRLTSLKLALLLAYALLLQSVVVGRAMFAEHPASVWCGSKSGSGTGPAQNAPSDDAHDFRCQWACAAGCQPHGPSSTVQLWSDAASSSRGPAAVTVGSLEPIKAHAWSSRAPPMA